MTDQLVIARAEPTPLKRDSRGRILELSLVRRGNLLRQLRELLPRHAPREVLDDDLEARAPTDAHEDAPAPDARLAVPHRRCS